MQASRTLKTISAQAVRFSRICRLPRLILRGRRFGMTLEECREIVDMYDGAGSSEVRQLQTLLGRLDEIAADLTARQDDLARTLAEVSDVAAQCRARLAELG